MLQVQELPDLLTVETRLCHMDRLVGGAGPGQVIVEPREFAFIIGHRRRAVQFPQGYAAALTAAGSIVAERFSVQFQSDWHANLPVLRTWIKLGRYA